MPKIVRNGKGSAWHLGYDITDTGGYGDIQISGMQTGCGLMQLYGFVYAVDEIDEDTYKTLIDCFNSELKHRLKEDGVGAIIATLGSSYYDDEDSLKFLKDTGFEEIAEFTNYRHNNGDTQKIFICKL